MKSGFTLIELAVGMAIIGFVAGISAIAWRTTSPGPAATLIGELEQTRARAVRMGKPQAWSADGQEVRFWPDGSSTGGRLPVDGVIIEIDPLSGSIHAAQ